MKPSIIFFDEIDALAPIRNTSDGQTHASVVATLLAEMDGLCDRFVSRVQICISRSLVFVFVALVH